MSNRFTRVSFFLIVFICIASGAMAQTILFSDTFASGTPGANINGQNLNNGLGGSQTVSWLATAGVTYATHTTSTQQAALDNAADRSLVNYSVNNTDIYRYEIKVDPCPTELGGSTSYFAGVVLRANAASRGFWDVNGIMLRFFNNSLRAPALDAFYGDGTNRLWPGGGGALALSDVDANGFFPASIQFTGDGTVAHPLLADVFVNGNKRGSYGPITDIGAGGAGDRIGFAAAYPGAYYDNVKLTNLGASVGPTNSELPAGVYKNVGDYTYMWWQDGLRNANKIINIQTSRYGLEIDADALTMPYFGPIASPATEANALMSANSVVDGVGAATISCQLKSGSTTYSSNGASTNTGRHPIIETGKFLQHRVFQDLSYAGTEPANVSYLEVYAWPDRVSYVLHIKPTVAIANGTMNLVIGVPSTYATQLTSGAGRALAVSSSGAGYCFINGGSVGSLSVNTSTKQATLTYAVGAWSANVEKVISLIVYPVSTQAQTALNNAVTEETSPLTVTTMSVSTVSTSTITTAYDASKGWYNVACTDGGTGNSRMQKVSLSVNNASGTTRTLRVNFGKDAGDAYITGISCILRGKNFQPAGLPIQISKNWHDDGSGKLYHGPWLHALTMLSVPPSANLTLEEVEVNGHWGGVAAASHNQLCLAGYSDTGNQQWDQSAMGSWGESICYDPDICLGRSMIDDVRPLMVWSMSQDTPVAWNWTNNVGGGDFLHYFITAGTKSYNIRMRTMFKRYCPNLTEATYGGTSGDGKLSVKATVSLIRSDDIVRGIYRIRYDATNTMTWNRMAFMQIPADGYNSSSFNKIARGDNNGLIEEWTPTQGGNSYSRTGIAMTGTNPWFSMHQAVTLDNSAYGAWANRGMVIRRYAARMNGTVNNTPYCAVYGSTDGCNNALVEISPASGVSQLINGDYVDMCIEHIIMPQVQSDYYGPNTNLYNALGTKGDTWQMIHREASGNYQIPTAMTGTIAETYPIKMSAVSDMACVKINGGLAYGSVTFTGLSTYKDPVLYQKTNDTWATVNQAVWGNDFWQADYDPVAKKYDITFNVPLDTTNDVRKDAKLRLKVGTATPDASAPGTPSGLTATVNGTTINLSWNANGEGDLFGYNVYRSTSSGFTPDYTNKLADCQAGTTYSDVGLSAGTTYYYKIKAVDKWDNESAASAQASGTASSSLIGWWKLNETSGTTAYDSSGYGNNGTKNAGTWTSASLLCSGTAGSMTIPAARFFKPELENQPFPSGSMAIPFSSPRRGMPSNRATPTRASYSRTAHGAMATCIGDCGNTSDGTYDRISKAAAATEQKGRWNHWVFMKNATAGDDENLPQWRAVAKWRRPHQNPSPTPAPWTSGAMTMPDASAMCASTTRTCPTRKSMTCIMAGRARGGVEVE